MAKYHVSYIIAAPKEMVRGELRESDGAEPGAGLVILAFSPLAD